MKRYNAVTGQTEYIPDPEPDPAFMPEPAWLSFTGAGTARPPARPGLFGGMDGLLKRFNLGSLETEDLILIGIFYLLYRESGDVEFLLIAGAMLFM
ncbi:MAG: hypothetical protein ACOX66_01120 [Oscillospiraceae bacterium]|jgi:hypothetical protein